MPILRCIVTIVFFADALLSFKITGATSGVDIDIGARPFRHEINNFTQAGAAFDLFVQALSQLQSMNQSEQLSYFQVAGIHGYPHIPWDGVIGTGDYPGYCLHAATPFPTWHRPYLALFEQLIWGIAQIIAESYPPAQIAEYQNAASTLRIPYWDWASTPALPDIVKQPTISINTRDGPQEVQNPLYNYEFHPGVEGNDFPSGHPMSNFPTTVRWWSASLNAENQSAADAALLANAPSILSMTYQLFTTVSDYTTFSCTWPGGEWRSANNIENIHNSIHNSVGGWGHMQFPEVAAFDPVFWLHHANVDRLFAMWQALYPGSYIEPTVNAYGSYYEPLGSIDSGNTSLAPFHSNNATAMFSSDDVRSTRLFGYSYPELPDWRLTESDLTAHVRQQINEIYNPNAFRNGTASFKRKSHRVSTYVSAFSDVTFDLAKDLGINNLDHQWSIRIDVDRYAWEGSFAIDFFMGIPPADVVEWATAPNLIGTHSQFIAQKITRLHPNGLPRGRLRGELSLTHVLAAGVARGILPNLRPESVVHVLKNGLSWRARAADGCEIHVSSLSRLSILVTSRTVKPTTFIDEFPVYGDLQQHLEVTRNKPGGAK